ncbi:MAG: SGNH/GDSL hydrolase family protein [Ferruginibacter sp.]|nr:SGNH/GDSL hydrolase family protein [Ferruginibacter sp.]
MTNYSYLALGDSYTIGEQVPFAENFPNQAVQLLRKKGFAFCTAEIIAKTGWTTDELLHAIENTITLNTYDFVTLLIGVNNQYRGRAVVDFEIELKQLLQKAVQFAGDKPSRVFVVSIPDWGITPFAEGRDRKKIAEEIDVYNYTCETIAKKYRCNYINITTSQREDGSKEIFLAPDGLHPSGKEYFKWAQKLANAILKQI